jgi:hypothetical protein
MLASGSASVSASEVRSASGVVARVSPVAAGPLQCLVSALERQGYPVRFMRGYGPGSVSGSLHPAGMALDVNQTARGRTTPRMPSNEVALARGCGVISGAVWANNDSGHFQLGGYDGSASRRHGHRTHHRHKRRHR